MQIHKNIKTCCFIGHRKIVVDDSLKSYLFNFVEKLIISDNVQLFLFGSKSQFDDLCYEIVSSLKSKYPSIKRVYVRSCNAEIDDFYKNYLLENFEDTFFPDECKNSGKISYIKRNQAMINQSDFCLFYYNENYSPSQKYNSKTISKSGTAIAFNYAKQKNKIIFNCFK